MVHFGSGLFQKVITAPLRAHDLNGVHRLNPELTAGDVLLGYRAFGSYGHLALLVSRGLQGLLRAHQELIVDFTSNRPHVEPRRVKGKQHAGLARSRWIQNLGPLDQIVVWFRPKETPAWLSAEAWAALPDSLRIRELRYHIGRPGFRVQTVTLVTTLIDPIR